MPNSRRSRIGIMGSNIAPSDPVARLLAADVLPIRRLFVFVRLCELRAFVLQLTQMDRASLPDDPHQFEFGIARRDGTCSPEPSPEKSGAPPPVARTGGGWRPTPLYRP
jgi:hypothetical protein